jgi:1,4-dihydroxy-2-naphthoate octaprenyltransferase
LASLSIILSFGYLIALVILEILRVEFLIILITLPVFLYLIKKMFSKPKSVYNSIKESVVARRIFFMLIVLGILVEFLIGFIAFI